MGLFQHKKTQTTLSDEEAAALEGHFLDENFREELRNHGRLYFEKVINLNADLFKQDLDATIAQVNTELKEHTIKQLDETISQINSELKDHVTKQLDEKFQEYGKMMKEAQDATLESLTKSAQDVQDQYQQFSSTLQKSIANQGVMASNVFEENMASMTEMKDTQKAAIEALQQSAEAVKKQCESLDEELKKNVATQEEALVTAFEGDMAHVIEHYLLGALGDQYDLKAQLPAIIQQMETNKQAIVDDMKL